MNSKLPKFVCLFHQPTMGSKKHISPILMFKQWMFGGACALVFSPTLSKSEFLTLWFSSMVFFAFMVFVHCAFMIDVQKDSSENMSL